MKRLEKATPVRLEASAYRESHRRILKRDGWKCQICGTSRHLQVHHIKFRSQSGSDEEENLITVCAGCHEQIHREKRDL